MSTKSKLHIKILRDEFDKRCKKNSRYSLRSYARFLGLSPGTVSQIMNGKKALSFNLSEKILEQISLSPKQAKSFLDSVAKDQSSRKMQRYSPRLKNYCKSKMALYDLSVEYYNYISEWYYVTILEMTELEDFKACPRWIAARLGIRPMEAKTAIERLLELGLLRKESQGLFKEKTHTRLQEMYTATSAARRKKQKQIREKAIAAIDHQDITKRSMTSLTMAVDPDLVPGAKKMIEEFNEKLCEYFQQGRKKEVYTLEVGLFSLHKK